MTFPQVSRRNLRVTLLALALNEAAITFGSSEFVQKANSRPKHGDSTLLLAKIRIASERCVVAFQMLSVSGFCLANLAPKRRWRVVGRRAFVATMCALGISGIACAAFRSNFALFAGFGLTLLFLLCLHNLECKNEPEGTE